MQRLFLRPRYVSFSTRRYKHAQYELKYAEKIQQRAREEGKSVAELKRKVREAATAKRVHERTTLPINLLANATEKHNTHALPSAVQKERKDSSPAKPLSSILNLDKIFASPHTPDQVSALWNAYHMSRAGGTGRGFLCASIPLKTYETMAAVATKYPSFVVPIPRSSTELQQGDKGDAAYEFYYLQWDFFHGAPYIPSAPEDPFAVPKTSANPAMSTILFTPLQEYKSRMSFATPYLVLTHYTDLAATHGIALLRGEITPCSNSAGLGTDIKYMLTQTDAQFLSMAVQKLYLWDADDKGKNDGGALLKQFHEDSKQFNWEDLLKLGNLGI